MKYLACSIALASVLFAADGVVTTTSLDDVVTTTSLDDGMICTQVVTYAQKEGSDMWFEFPNPCYVPDGWTTTYQKPDNVYKDTSVEEAKSSIIHLSKDWNLIGATQNIESMAAFDKSCATKVYGFKNGEYTIYDVSTQNADVAAESTEVFSIAKGEGFFVRASEDCTVNLADPTLSTSKGETTEIKGGETKSLYDSALIITVDSINDSRCPMDAVCIVAGEVNVGLKITGTEEIDENVTLKEGESFATAQGYTVTLKDVTPFPMASNPVDFEAKTVVLEIFQ